MPESVLVTKRTVIENSAVILTARVVDSETGDLLVPADVSAATIKSFDKDTGTQVTTATLTPGDIILDPPDDGYLADNDTDNPINLKIPLAGSYVPDGDKAYQIELKITPASGDPFYLLWELKTKAIFTE